MIKIILQRYNTKSTSLKTIISITYFIKYLYYYNNYLLNEKKAVAAVLVASVLTFFNINTIFRLEKQKQIIKMYIYIIIKIIIKPASYHWEQGT